MNDQSVNTQSVSILFSRRFDFAFGRYPCATTVRSALPSMKELIGEPIDAGALFVCDENTRSIAHAIGGETAKYAVLTPGEASKGWAAVEAILRGAMDAGLGRDGVFIGVGGGVVTDLAAFAASVYMRGTRLALVPTTLLGMADAALGGKTGFDLFDVKNLVGTFRPADSVFMATDALSTLPAKERLSGLAEVIKTAVIGDTELLGILEAEREAIVSGSAREALADMVARCVAVKGRIVESDPTETGTERALLNLGHTFGHALESVAGLGVLTHGEAVAWGIARACALGRTLGLTTPARARRIVALIDAYGYETAATHPAAIAAAGGNAEDASKALLHAMVNDKKKKSGQIRFIVPNDSGAVMTSADLKIVRQTVLGGSNK